MQRPVSTFVSSVAIGIVLAGAALTMVGSEAKARVVAATPMAMTGLTSNVHLADLASRVAKNNTTSVEYKSAEVQVHSLQAKGDIRTALDYFNAGRILAKSKSFDSVLLAHDFAVASLALGEPRAKTLAAITEDRMLVQLGRPQRFGTQAKSAAPIAEKTGVTDAMRKILDLPAEREAAELVAKGKLFDRLEIALAQPVLRPAAAIIAAE